MEEKQSFMRSMTRNQKIFWWVGHIAALIAIVVLAVFVGIFSYRNGLWNTQVDNLYRQSYYTLTDNLLNMENNLSKIRVVRGEELQQQLLTDTALAAQSATASLGALSHGGYDMSPIIKYCNQVGDYCMFGVRKITFGLGLNDQDYQTFADMHTLTNTIAEKLNAVRDEITDSGEKFVMGLGEMGKSLYTAFESLTGTQTEYPSLIYDGPFSDSLEAREPLALKGMEDMNSADPLSYVARFFPGERVTQATFLSANESKFPSYLYEFRTEQGRTGSIQLSKQGGMALMWDMQVDVQDPKLSKEEAVELAKQYCTNIGLTNMTPVWASISASTVYVNLCYTVSDVICYPDMVKVKVSLDDGAIIGFEALNYLYNHTQRESSLVPKIPAEQASEMDYGKMQVSATRLCLVPTVGGSEQLAWEVYGTIDEYKFFIYVNADTGKQFKIMQVIDSDEGELLM